MEEDTSPIVQWDIFNVTIRGEAIWLLAEDSRGKRLVENRISGELKELERLDELWSTYKKIHNYRSVKYTQKKLS